MSNTIPKYHIQDVAFLGSFPSVEKAPVVSLPEFAFIGRSNVGKSSLINYICNRKKLAKTSSTPGKTQFINLFKVEEKWVLADLPGYGYAKISKKMRAKWGRMIEQYLLRREMLGCVFLLIDARVPAQEIDLDMIDWLGSNQIPFVLVFTKTDKLKPQQLKDNMVAFFSNLRETWEQMPHHILSSSLKGKGKEEIMDLIQNVVDDLD